MFTGLITDVGRIVSASGGAARIATAYPAHALSIGGSIACDGCCLTMTEVAPDGDGAWFGVDLSNETLSRTTLGRWREGACVNLERPLRQGDELGGHFVTGHVDGLARIVDRRSDGASVRFMLEAPIDLSPLIASKGSVALAGVSLTVNEVDGRRFGVNIIPHTLSATTLGAAGPGDDLNLEADLLARYVARLVGSRSILD
jgi:riboflavin synthase